MGRGAKVGQLWGGRGVGAGLGLWGQADRYRDGELVWGMDTVSEIWGWTEGWGDEEWGWGLGTG